MEKNVGYGACRLHHRAYEEGGGGWGSNVNSCNGTTLPPNGIFSYAHNPPLFFTETSVIKNLQLKTLITDHVYDKKVHDWSVRAAEESVCWCVGDTDVNFTQKMVLNSLRTVSDPAASASALKSITRRGHRWWPYGADGNRELSCILMQTEHHTHINTDFRVYIELSCWPSVSALGQTTEIWYGFKSFSETKSGARLMRSWPLKDFGKAITSLILGAPTIMDISRSRPVQEKNSNLIIIRNAHYIVSV